MNCIFKTPYDNVLPDKHLQRDSPRALSRFFVSFRLHVRPKTMLNNSRDFWSTAVAFYLAGEEVVRRKEGQKETDRRIHPGNPPSWTLTSARSTHSVRVTEGLGMSSTQQSFPGLSDVARHLRLL